jgi:hypothetical protein
MGVPAGRRWSAAGCTSAGFSLLELLLALGLGLLLSGLILQALTADGQGLQRLLWLQRQGLLHRRLLGLLRGELLRAEALEIGRASGAACPLAGRTPVLHLRLRGSGAITYSLGAPPSAIWRPQVLMRCGPAYGLDGEPSIGLAQQRVVLDGLARQGLQATSLAPGLLRLRLEQPGRNANEPALITSRDLAHGGR